MTKITYFAFGNRQPDGTDSNPQDCMFFYAADSYRFYDFHCAYDFGGYICEK